MWVQKSAAWQINIRACIHAKAAEGVGEPHARLEGRGIATSRVLRVLIMVRIIVARLITALRTTHGHPSSGAGPCRRVVTLLIGCIGPQGQ